MKVIVPSALHSYTQCGEVQAEGTTLGEVLDDLDRRYPGLRFRVVDEQERFRRHIRVFVDGRQVDDLARPLGDTDEVFIVQALSGG